jgi:hypothetical protein
MLTQGHSLSRIGDAADEYRSAAVEPGSEPCCGAVTELLAEMRHAVLDLYGKDRGGLCEKKGRSAGDTQESD